MKLLERTSLKLIRILKHWWPIIFSFFALKVRAQNFNYVTQANSAQTINIVKLHEQIIVNTMRFRSQTLVSTSKDCIDAEDVFKLIKNAHLPMSHIYITSGFGFRTHPVTGEKNKFHSGIDLNARKDTVFSILHGLVQDVGYNKILGNYIRIIHGNYTSIYGHLSVQFVKPGQYVAPGIPIGISGETGRVTGEHLHFSIKYKNQFINPLQFLYQILNLSRQSLYYSLIK